MRDRLPFGCSPLWLGRSLTGAMFNEPDDELQALNLLPPCQAQDSQKRGEDSPHDLDIRSLLVTLASAADPVGEAMHSCRRA